MTEAGVIPDKWGGEAMMPTVEFFHSAVRKLVAERLAASGKTWEEAVVDPSLELTREDFARIAASHGDTKGARKVARVAVARKILTLVYYGLRDGTIRSKVISEAA